MYHILRVLIAMLVGGMMMACLAACLGPTYKTPVLNNTAIQAETIKLQHAAIEKKLRRRARLYDLTWPVLEANADLCPKTRKRAGIVLADLKQFSKLVGGLTEKQLIDLGYAEELRIVHVMTGSPAETAGLQSGDILMRIDDEGLDRKATPKKASKAISTAFKDQGHVTITVLRDDKPTDLKVIGRLACDVAVKLSSSDTLNARAMDDTFIMNSGLMRVLDDGPLQYVIAHEVAHVALRHQHKVIRNSIVSGSVVYGPFLYGLGTVADSLARIAGIEKYRSLSTSAVAASVPYLHDYEAEADYVGLYMYVRAGGNISMVDQAFRLFATESPTSTWIRYTHPLTPERIIALEATLREIEAKQARGEALIPTLVDN